MRIDVKKTAVYSYDELSDSAKETVLEKFRDINVDHEWWDFIYEDTKEIGRLMGIDIENIYFAGFSSKGDGACFEGHYEYMAGSVEAIKAYAPKDEELRRIAEELMGLQKRCFYQIRASVKHRGHYYHRFCTDINVDFESHVTGQNYYDEEIEKDLVLALRDLMHWIYKQLEKNYEYLTKDETIIETIEANEYEFTVEGKYYEA